MDYHIVGESDGDRQGIEAGNGICLDYILLLRLKAETAILSDRFGCYRNRREAVAMEDPILADHTERKACAPNHGIGRG